VHSARRGNNMWKPATWAMIFTAQTTKSKNTTSLLPVEVNTSSNPYCCAQQKVALVDLEMLAGTSTESQRLDEADRDLKGSTPAC